MKKQALIPVIIIIFSLAGLTGVLAYPSYVIDYGGNTHGGCHATNPMGGPPTVISTANFTFILSNTSILETDTLFTLTAHVNNFTDVINDLYYENETTIGFSLNHTTPNDNNLFLFKPSSYATNALDSNGELISDVDFEIVTPSSPGTYKLLITAISGYNVTADDAAQILAIDTELDLLVIAKTPVDLGPGGENLLNIPGFDLFFLSIAIFMVIIPSSILLIRKLKKKAL